MTSTSTPTPRAEPVRLDRPRIAGPPGALALPAEQMRRESIVAVLPRARGSPTAAIRARAATLSALAPTRSSGLTFLAARSCASSACARCGASSCARNYGMATAKRCAMCLSGTRSDRSSAGRGPITTRCAADTPPRRKTAGCGSPVARRCSASSPPRTATRLTRTPGAGAEAVCGDHRRVTRHGRRHSRSSDTAARRVWDAPLV